MLAIALVVAVGAAPDEGLVEDTAVKNRLFSVAQRWEAGLTAGVPLNARLTEHYVFDAHAAYNVAETFAVEGMGGYAYSQWTGIARQVTSMPGIGRSRDELSDLWELSGHALAGARWQPLYGKVGVFGEALHFQVYAWLGAGAGLFRRLPELSTSTLRTQVNALFSVAFGARLFWSGLGDRHAVRLEVRDFSWVDSYSTSAGQRTGLTNMVQLSLGYTFLF